MVHSFHWCTVTHRGFPGGGGANHKDGGVNLVFCPISPKSYNETEKNWTQRGRVSLAPPRILQLKGLCMEHTSPSRSNFFSRFHAVFWRNRPNTSSIKGLQRRPCALIKTNFKRK